ncbi:hypothetical protein SAMN04488063_1264 [Halopelagius inordinatus]|uniref:Uncharacterized protein n=1 Tax=Halopelagius inordinatus TaxID=553467 RepID=A0A1I2NMC8_9EURY|nr:hypothetical protein [Halopelagius inordinatus]SFG05044.1 hypothetical protein SAMN04488063_1264 [Halopelagius inordinatus]
MREAPDGFADADRAVSTAIGYVLTLTISAMLVSGLLFAGGQYVDDEREQVTRGELATLAEQLAASLADADRMAASGDADAIRVAAELPTRVAGNTYLVAVSNEATPSGQPNRTVVTLTSSGLDVSASVTFPTTRDAAPGELSGGPLVVVVRDADGDGKGELVTTTEPLSPDSTASLDGDGAAFATFEGGYTASAHRDARTEPNRARDTI